MPEELLNSNLKTEEEVEEEANSHQGILRNIRIAKCERLRFFLFAAMFFLIGFIYSFMRILKDLFVMERQDPNCFNFIKIFYILPISFGIVVGINFMLQHRTVGKIFTIFLTLFAILFIFFGLALIFEKDYGIDSKSIKDHFKKSNSLVKYFMYTVAEPLATLIYISAEMWGTIILSYLYLSYLNECCSFKQHSRFIPVLFIFINFSLLTSAIFTSIMRYYITKLKGQEKNLLMASFFFLEGGLAFLVLVCKFYLEKHVLSVPIFIPTRIRRVNTPKPRSTLKESLKVMRNSKFLLAMCVIVFFFSVMINLLETVYKIGIKAGAKELNIPPAEHSAKLNNYDQYITSLSVIFLNLTSFSSLTSRRGWTFVALISPIVAILGVVFILGMATYNTAVNDDSVGVLNSAFSGDSPNYLLENYGGMVAMSMLRVSKYVAFDVTKENISMRIEKNTRPKFKSIYDGVFNKLGKSGGSIYSIGLAAIISGFDPRSLSPISALVSLLFIGCWVYSDIYLGKSYKESLENDKPINLDLVNDMPDLLEENNNAKDTDEEEHPDKLKTTNNPQIIITRK